MRPLLFIFFVFLSVHCASTRVNNELKLFEENRPVCLCNKDKAFSTESTYVFNKISGLIPNKIRISDNCKSTEFTIALQKTSHSDFYFQVAAGENGITLSAQTSSGMMGAIHYFLIHVLGFIPYDYKRSLLKYDTRAISENFVYTASFNIFNYREPYFIENYKNDFRFIHHTQTIDDTWALWGHNIPKKIKVTPKMLAQVDGELSEEQLCFSSKELRAALFQFVRKSQTDYPDAKKIMVLPNDNNEVCTCESCRKLGNTKTNASPAVFQLINELAIAFPKLEFFGAAYTSTKEVPDFELKSNVGVVLTTMHWPKGVALKNSKSGLKIQGDIGKWKSKTKLLYVWDYVIHFDNYLSTFPTILSTQENLKWFRDFGVQGIFLHGTEEGYAAFSDLKAFVYAQLLMNPNYDVEYLVQTYFRNFFPNNADLLTRYYLEVENRSLMNSAFLDIYGGWNQDLKKYLQEEELFKLVAALDEGYMLCSEDEKSNLNPLLAALYFQKLEIHRLKGVNKFGLLSLDSNSDRWRTKKELEKDLKQWEWYAGLSGLGYLNESKIPIGAYHEHWKALMNQEFKCLFTGSSPKALSVLDEDYQNTAMLTDGALGFQDYFNNWFISSEALNLRIPIATKKNGVFKLEIGFLHQPRHRIYWPESIQVTIGNRKYLLKIEDKSLADSKNPYRFAWDIEINNEDFVEILLIKQPKFAKFATAIDEIRLLQK